MFEPVRPGSSRAQSSPRHKDVNRHDDRHRQPEGNSDGSVQKIAQAFRDLNIEHDFLRLFGRPKLADQRSLSSSLGAAGKVFASEVKRFRSLGVNEKRHRTLRHDHKPRGIDRAAELIALHIFELGGNHGFIAPRAYPLTQIKCELLDLMQICVVRKVERHPEETRHNLIGKTLAAIRPAMTDGLGRQSGGSQSVGIEPVIHPWQIKPGLDLMAVRCAAGMCKESGKGADNPLF